MSETPGSHKKAESLSEPRVSLGSLEEIVGHLTDLAAPERLLVESCSLERVLFNPEQSKITIIMDSPVDLAEKTVEKIGLAAIKAIPGMQISVECVVKSSSAPPKVDPSGDWKKSVEEGWEDIVAAVRKSKSATGPWLIVSKPRAAEKTVTVLCANALAVDRLTRLDAAADFASAIETLCGRRLAIHFEAANLELPIALERRAVPRFQASRTAARKVWLGAAAQLKGAPIPIHDVTTPARDLVVEGEVFNVNLREGRKTFIAFGLTDLTDSIRVKLFDPPPSLMGLAAGERVRVAGRVAPDPFERDELVLTPRVIVAADPPPQREDTAAVKRVELNLHTKSSRLNGLIEIDRLIERVKRWGWKGFAVTDDAVVQSFPKIHAAATKAGLKVALGCQVNLANDLRPIVENLPDAGNVPAFTAPAVIFDLETTGLGARSNKVIEIAAYRVERNRVVDEFHSFVNPHEPLCEVVKRITRISDEMLVGAPEWPEVLAAFRLWAGDAFLVAHNIGFDAGFLRKEWPTGERMPILVDTLGICRALLHGVKNYQLGTIAKKLGISLVEAHRAADDARALARLYIELTALLEREGITTLDGLAGLGSRIEARKLHTEETTLLVADERGRKNLYQLVTAAHLDHLYIRPRVPASLLERHRAGLVAGSGATDGPVAEAMISGDAPERIEALARRFDYLEIGPPDIYAEKLGIGIFRDEEDVRAFIRETIALGERVGRPVVAVSKAHHLEAHERLCRTIVRTQKSAHLPSQHLRTTDEMLAALDFLGEETARTVVIDAPHAILERCGEVAPLPKGFFPPVIEGAEKELRERTSSGAAAFFGATLPPLVAERLEFELEAIIGNGFSVLYLIAIRLVASSKAKGFVVGSRGSVGSSLVAFVTGITEVNPLPPHHRCPACHAIAFAEKAGACGPDLPPRECCGMPMIRDGYDIPFEAFMGWKGKKIPDIDLNFAGEYQARAMAEIEETFGREHVFRAGTINTLKERNARGLVLKHLEAEARTCRSAEVDRLALGITDVARTTGQHPGGIVIIPRDKEMADFMPVQRPADSESVDAITTHFDFHSYEGTVVKVDVLGHDCPTAIRMLHDLTGIDPMTVPIDDPGLLSLFASPKALGVKESRLGCPVGTLGIPEFGTPLTTAILTETRPTTIEELIRISGLSHGKGVWQGNAQDLIRSRVAKLSQVIATREDIMNGLVRAGLDPERSFQIMEQVRKGKGLKPEDEALMKKSRVPAWIIDSLKAIRYMFPKAHAVAYVLMALRIAWFKVHRPAAFYATWLSLKVGDFDLATAMAGERAVSQTMAEIRRKEKDRSATAKEESRGVVLEVLREMFLRGIQCLPVSIAASDVSAFRVEEDGVRPPLIAVEGLGEKAARRVGEELTKGDVATIDDLVARTGLSRPIVERLKGYKAFGDLPETNQLALF